MKSGSRSGSVFIIALVVVVVLAAVGGIWWYETRQSSPSTPSPSTSQSEPRINSLSPSSTVAYSQGGNGSAATILAQPLAITIHGSGFTTTGNTVNFTYGSIDNLTSTDGETITFTFGKSQSQLLQCTGGNMAAAFCEDIPVGSYPISVANTNGTSNQMIFEVTSTAVVSNIATSTATTNTQTNGWLRFKDNVSGLSILYPSQYTAQRKTIIGTSGKIDIYSPSSPNKSLVSISYGPIGRETSQDAFKAVLLNMPSVQKIYPSFTYSTSTTEVLGQFPAQVIAMSGDGQDGAIYFFTGSQFIYQITEDYSADATLTMPAAKNLEDSIVSTIKING